MILVDAGPLVALFDARDAAHDRCEEGSRAIQEPFVTTVPVLVEAFHLLDPRSRGAQALQDVVLRGGVGVWFLSDPALSRAFGLMRRYADHPMDLADASLVTAAEVLRTTTLFALDHDDFATYRVRLGQSWRHFLILG